MTDDLVAKLRDEDSYYRLQEKHWCIDAEELERQRLEAADRIEQLEAEVKTALHREAETTARYDAKIDALEAEIARKDEALRECRRAVSGGREEPRRRVRDIVDLTLRKPAALGETK